MKKERFRIEDNRFTVNLTVWHKPFGWFVFLTFGVLGVLFFPSFEYLVFGLISFWSIRRKREICWYSEEKKWSYRKRNFFTWTETKYDMSDQDLLTLRDVSSNGMGDSRSNSLFMDFTPKAELKDRHFFSTDDFILSVFNSPITVSQVSEPIIKIKDIYSIAGKTLVIDLTQLGERNTLLLEKELELI